MHRPLVAGRQLPSEPVAFGVASIAIGFDLRDPFVDPAAAGCGFVDRTGDLLQPRHVRQRQRDGRVDVTVEPVQFPPPRLTLRGRLIDFVAQRPSVADDRIDVSDPRDRRLQIVRRTGVLRLVPLPPQFRVLVGDRPRVGSHGVPVLNQRRPRLNQLRDLGPGRLADLQPRHRHAAMFDLLFGRAVVDRDVQVRQSRDQSLQRTASRRLQPLAVPARRQHAGQLLVQLLDLAGVVRDARVLRHLLQLPRVRLDAAPQIPQLGFGQIDPFLNVASSSGEVVAQVRGPVQRPPLLVDG